MSKEEIADRGKSPVLFGERLPRHSLLMSWLDTFYWSVVEGRNTPSLDVFGSLQKYNWIGMEDGWFQFPSHIILPDALF